MKPDSQLNQAKGGNMSPVMSTLIMSALVALTNAEKLLDEAYDLGDKAMISERLKLVVKLKKEFSYWSQISKGGIK